MKREKFVKIPDLRALVCPKCGGKTMEMMTDNTDYLICRSCITLFSYDECMSDGKPCWRLKNLRSKELFILKDGSHWQKA